MDECEVHTHPSLAKVWRRKGCPMRLPAAGEDQAGEDQAGEDQAGEDQAGEDQAGEDQGGEDQKFTVFGAVDDASGRVLWQASERTGEAAFAAFLDHLAETLPADEPAVLVLDNAGDHKSRELRTHWQRLSERFQPFFLPAYAPQLNLIERLWRYLKAKLACHRWWHDRDRLMQATAALLDALEVHFHADDEPAFRPVHNLCQSA